MRIVLSVGLAVVLVSLSALTEYQFAQAQPDAQFGRNLILNGDAEAGPGAADDEAIAPPPQWTVTTGFTAVRYGALGEARRGHCDHDEAFRQLQRRLRASLTLGMRRPRILHRDDVACFHQQVYDVLHPTHFANRNLFG